MNENIRELHLQALEYADSYADPYDCIWFRKYNEKFAELIVLDTIEIVNQFEHYPQEVSEDAEIYLDEAIKLHFGVK